MQQFIESTGSVSGSVVSVAGFLEVIGYPQLELAAEENASALAPRVFLTDVDLRQKGGYRQGRKGEALYLEDLGCTQKWAIVTGLVGLTPFNAVGLTTIEEVRTFGNAQFSGAGVVCYRR
ncbi:MAG: hypothetical protein ABL957_15640 [Parvularculaceae bacterium]